MFEKVEETKKDGEQPLHFYYNREERISKAPESVKKYYRGEMKPVKGFKVLFTGSNKFIFIAIVFFVGMVWIYSGFNKSRNYAKIEGIDCEVVSYAYEDSIYSSVSFNWNPKTQDKTPKNIIATMYLINADNQIANKEEKQIFYKNDTQYIRFKNMDLDIIRCDVEIKINNTQKEISTVVKR